MSTEVVGTRLAALSAPATQIRLLLLRSGADDETIRGDISHWTLADAPSFRAISYTWGLPEDQRTVTVDGQRWIVRQNCAYSLWQARHHFPNSYIWIDSICIDQHNLQEKAVQVDMMGSIYAKASTVLACVGPSDQSSAYVSKVLANLDAFINDVPGGWWDAHNIDFEWYPLGTSILCGAGLLEWNSLVDLHYRMNACFNPYTDNQSADYKSSRAIGAIYRRLLAYDRNFFQFPSILEESGNCEDPRDRIYGILRLIDWARFRAPRPVPDYSISLPHLALNAIQRVRDLDLHSAITIVSSLGVKLDELIGTLPSLRDADEELHDQTEPTRGWTTGVYGACRVYEDEAQRLCVDMIKTKIAADMTVAGNAACHTEDRSAHGGIVTSASQPHTMLYAGSSPSAYCDKHVLPGDVLVATHYVGTLLLRRSTTKIATYEVVSKASLIHPYIMPRSRWNCYCWSGLEDKPPSSIDVRLALEITDAEALLLGASDTNGNHVQALGVDAVRIGTLVTDVTASEVSEWQEHQIPRPFPRECSVHGANALDLSLVAHCGGSGETNSE